MAAPELVVLKKLEFFRKGRSPKHLRAIRSMLEVSANKINLAELEKWT